MQYVYVRTIAFLYKRQCWQGPALPDQTGGLSSPCSKRSKERIDRTFILQVSIVATGNSPIAFTDQMAELFQLLRLQFLLSFEETQSLAHHFAGIIVIARSRTNCSSPAVKLIFIANLPRLMDGKKASYVKHCYHSLALQTYQMLTLETWNVIQARKIGVLER